MNPLISSRSLMWLTAVLVVAFLSSCDSRQDWTDAKVRDVFSANSGTFSEIVTTLKKTKQFRSFECDRVTGEGRVPVERSQAIAAGMIEQAQWEKLCMLKKRLPLADAIGMAEDRSAVMFWLEVYGLAVGGRVIGIMYAEEKPSPLFDSIDDIPKARGRYYSALSEPSWYILWWIE